MIRAFYRFYAKHPRICFAGMLFACAVALYTARRFDSDNTAALRLQMLATTPRSSV